MQWIGSKCNNLETDVLFGTTINSFVNDAMVYFSFQQLEEKYLHCILQFLPVKNGLQTQRPVSKSQYLVIQLVEHSVQREQDI